VVDAKEALTGRTLFVGAGRTVGARVQGVVSAANLDEPSKGAGRCALAAPTS
jgi:hypothetical protein